MNDLTTAGKLPSSLLRRLFLLCWFVATVAGAQTSEVDLFRQLSPQHDSDSIEMKTLYLDADALAFFKDNEYDGNITKGYTLPGVRFTPHLVYSPRAELRFELGASALVYDGTNRYPNYAFHDIVTWKGGAYQGGAHVLPYFRAVVRMGAATFVLGDLYGGASHELILPLYKPENLLTTDPEKGFQTQISTQRWKMDAWIDWQSFIFEMDKHQEAFTVGMTQRVHLLRPRPYGWSLDVPLQMTVQHRGGEQDDTDLGVQTLSNGSIGLQLRKTWDRRVLNAAEVELHALGAYQQAGKLWPFNTGSGLWAGAALDLLHALRLRVGWWQAKDFVTLYGSPFFNTLSLKVDGARFTRMNTAYWSVEYVRPFGRDYAFGAKANGFLTDAGRLHRKDGSTDPAALRHAFSFGVFLRAQPRFLLKRFK
jgi:hypothetical protein